MSSNICVIRIPEGEKRDLGQKQYLRITSDDLQFSKTVERYQPTNSRSLVKPKQVSLKKTTLRHIIVNS